MPLLARRLQRGCRQSSRLSWSGGGRVLTAVVSCRAVESAGMGMMVPLLPMLAEGVGIGASGVGLMVGAASTGKIFSSLAIGRVADKSENRKILMILGRITWSLSVLGTALSTTFFPLLLSRFTMGVAAAASTACATAYVTDIAASMTHNKNLTLCSLDCASSFSYAAGPLLGGILVTHLGVSSPFYILGAASAAAVFAVHFYLPDGTGAKKIEGNVEKVLSFKSIITGIRTAPEAIILGRVATYVGWGAMLTLVPLQAATVWGATATDIGIVFSVAASVGIICMPVAATLVDKFGSQHLYRIAAVLAVVGCTGVACSSTYLQFFVSFLVWETGEGILASVLTSVTVETAAENRKAELITTTKQAGEVALLLSCPLFGVLADVFSPTCGLLTCASLTAALFLRSGYTMT